MKIPRRFAFEGEWIRVSLRKGLTHGGKPVDGFCKPWLKRIWIRSEMSSQDKWKTFVHEYLHFVLDNAKLTAAHNGPLSEKAEEDVIKAIEKGLFERFRLNWRKDY